MKIDLKVAIVRSGRPQYAIAQDLGIPETKLSKYLRGRVTLRPDEEARLRSALGLPQEGEASQ